MNTEQVIQFERSGTPILFDGSLEEDHMIRTIRRTGDFYEADLLDWIASINLPEGSVVDAGAFVGNHTVYFARILGRQVIAFEPNPAAFEYLKTNIRLNSLESKVDARNLGLGREKARAVLAGEIEGNLGGTSLDLTGEDGDVAVDSLDDSIDPETVVGLIKIDVEGMEPDVLIGAAETISRCRPLIAVECMNESRFREVARLLRKENYRPASIFAATPVIIFCPVEKTADVFWGDPPNFFQEYRQHKNHVLQFTLARKQRENEAKLRERIADVLGLLKKKEDEASRLRADTLQLRKSFAEEKSRLERESAGRLEKKSAEIEERWAARIKEERSGLDDELSMRAERIRELSEGVEAAKEAADRTRADLRETRRALAEARVSLRYEIGDAIALAVRRPGRNTIALPWRLARIFLKALKGGYRSGRESEPAGFGPPLPEPAGREPAVSVSPPGELTDLRVACIMDKFTRESFRHECRLLEVTPANWRVEVESFRPHLLFVESAWRGRDDLWRRKIDYSAPELIDLVHWCNANGVPTAFWNKEDPVHFDTFINTAHYFDHVFTTDIDCIGRYKSKLGHERVHLLPFACQPAAHNPVALHERKDRFCFAGAYYKRYPERQRDLEMFVEILSETRGIDIYDRNHGDDDPNYRFPDRYLRHILGKLPFEKIDVAYKGYRYGVSLNSIKQSQTMFARRAFELIASNTVTVSNYSRGLRLLMGDLVISTDDAGELKRRLDPFFRDDAYYRKYRLAGLRKVLEEHTYQHRLAFLAGKAFLHAKEYDTGGPSVLALASVGDEREFEKALAHYRRQRYARKSLVLLLGERFLPDDCPLEEGIYLLSRKGAERRRMSDLPAADFVAAMVPGDYYGPNYVGDFSSATRYTGADCIGKGAHHVREGGAVVLKGDGGQYRSRPELDVRSAMVRRGVVADRTVFDWVESHRNGTYRESTCFGIDEFNYCRDSGEDAGPVVDDLEGLDPGVALPDVIEAAGAIEIEDGWRGLPGWSGRDLGEKLNATGVVELIPVGSRLVVRSRLEEGEHHYVYGEREYRPADLNANRELNVYFDIHVGVDVRLVFLFLDGAKEKLESFIALGNRNQRCVVPAGTKWVRVGLRVAGAGEGSVNHLFFEHLDSKAGCFVGRSENLLLTNLYPQYDDLYRYGFLHRRLVEYKNQGVNVDVLRFNPLLAAGFGEFEGIDVATGSSDELRSALRSGRFRKVLVHFLDPMMWNVLKEFVDKIEIVVWLHGSEVQPWTRRMFNYRTTREKLVAARDSRKRMKFWRGLFGEAHGNLRYVFVSEYFAREVMEDVGIELRSDQYSIIHNFIDTTLFSYTPKPADQRMKILSIRPFATRKYANDLSVEAVLELSREPFFRELRFLFFGDGPLFEETMAPLRDFENVSMERRFLAQDEIARLHKEYGVFLNPTRMDAQGVSRDEAMSSGLVPVTNGVTAIPEFVDADCGVLAGPEDAAGLADGIRRLYLDPDLFQRLSANAARRVRAQSGLDSTIRKELLLIGVEKAARSEREPQPVVV